MPPYNLDFNFPKTRTGGYPEQYSVIADWAGGFNSGLRSTAGDWQAAVFLFFVGFDVCEAKKGDCRLWLDESGAFAKTDGKLRAARGTKWQDITDQHKNPPDFGRILLRKFSKSSGKICNRMLFFMDAALATVPIGKEHYQHIPQKIKITDRGGVPVAEIRHEIDIRIDKKGFVSFDVFPYHHSDPFHGRHGRYSP